MTTPALNALIVDDEPVARRRLRRLLAFEPDVELAGECSPAAEAKAFLAQRPIDLLFLDIQMPDGDGFSVLSGIAGPRPSVVFVTAFDEHAVRAFEVEDAHDRRRVVLDVRLEGHRATGVTAALMRLEPVLGVRWTD